MRKRNWVALLLVCVVVLSSAVMLAGCKKKPSLNSLSPNSGTPGSSFTINGKDFSAGFGTKQGSKFLVHFGSELAAVESWSETTIVAKVPSDLKAGEYEVSVETDAGTSGVMPFTVTEAPPAHKAVPQISSLLPTGGPSGTKVTIYGKDFGSSHGSSKVNLGPVQFEVTSWSDSKIEVKVPANMGAGQYEVSVVNANGTSNAMPFVVTAQADPKQLQEEAVHDYMVAQGINPGEWTHKQSKESTSDPSWALFVYQRFEGMGHMQFLLHQVGGKWQVVASGGEDFDPQAHGAPADLKN